MLLYISNGRHLKITTHLKEQIIIHVDLHEHSIPSVLTAFISTAHSKDKKEEEEESLFLKAMITVGMEVT